MDKTKPDHCRQIPALLAVVVVWAGLVAEAVAQGSAATERAALGALYDMTVDTSGSGTIATQTPRLSGTKFKCPACSPARTR